MPNVFERIRRLEQQHGDKGDLPVFLNNEERLRYWRDFEAQIRYDKGGSWTPNRFHQTVEQAARWMARHRLILRRANKEMEVTEHEQEISRNPAEAGDHLAGGRNRTAETGRSAGGGGLNAI